MWVELSPSLPANTMAPTTTGWRVDHQSLTNLAIYLASFPLVSPHCAWLRVPSLGRACKYKLPPLYGEYAYVSVSVGQAHCPPTGPHWVGDDASSVGPCRASQALSLTRGMLNSHPPPPATVPTKNFSRSAFVQVRGL